VREDVDPGELRERLHARLAEVSQGNGDRVAAEER
jgi:hypothetical protein